MLENNKCLLTYNLTSKEMEELKSKDIKLIKITEEMAGMTINDILNGLRIVKYNIKLPDEKVILFNSYNDAEIKQGVKDVRQVVTGGILASVTPNSVKWTFEYLLNHLIEEREWFNKQQKG